MRSKAEGNKESPAYGHPARKEGGLRQSKPPGLSQFFRELAAKHDIQIWPVFRFYSGQTALQPEPGFSMVTLLNFCKADVVVVIAYSDADVVRDDYLVPFLAKD